MFFAIQGGCWVYFALHHGSLPPSECIPLQKCLTLHHYITFQPVVAHPGCSIRRSNTNPLSQIQTPHPQGESSTPSITLEEYLLQPTPTLPGVSLPPYPSLGVPFTFPFPLPPLLDAPFSAPTPTGLARFKPHTRRASLPHEALP